MTLIHPRVGSLVGSAEAQPASSQLTTVFISAEGWRLLVALALASMSGFSFGQSPCNVEERCMTLSARSHHPPRRTHPPLRSDVRDQEQVLREQPCDAFNSPDGG
jgi:hypothetical protein